jgi:glycosyltransferase involved in cell wall biosynthesis
MPKVSIIMPMYNQENYIRECLESVINQTLKDIEIIVVNDGSKDKSLEIVQEYAKKDPRIIIIDKPNTGYGDSMNVGINRATGEYIGIVETDDFVALDMYETLYNVAKDKDVEVIKADFYRFTGDVEDKEFAYGELSKDKNYYNKITSAYEDKTIFYLTMMNWSGIYKRSFLNAHNIRHNTTPGASYQDNGFWFQIFSLAKTIYFLDKPLYRVRRDNPNSSINSKSKVYCICEEYQYIYKFLEKNPDIKEKFTDVYYNKMISNYRFTYNRVAEEYKQDFLLRFASDFRFAFDMELLKEEQLIPANLAYIKKILAEAKPIEKRIKEENKKKDYFYYLNLDPADYEKELKLWYKDKLGYELDLDNPITYTQKIQWMKLYDSTLLKSELSDKYRVREWVKNKIGEKYLIPLLGVWDKFDEIDFDKLPDKFVLKCNHGCGYNHIVLDKRKLNLKELKDKFDEWMEQDFAFRYGLQLHYSNIEHKIIAEEYVENKGNDLYDYKIWCFNGEAKYIMFMQDRYISGAKMAFYDINWAKQEFAYYPPTKNEIPRPKSLDLMLDLARTLSKDFYHARVDFYELNDGTVKFGEMTFTSSSGDNKWSPKVYDYKMGQLFSLPNKTEFKLLYQRPKLSVVIPVYNAEKYISECLDSILYKQKLKNIEVICVDDCSTDGSLTILNNYAKKDSRVIVLKNEKNINAGLSRNKGIEIAKGEYITFIDSDDFVENDILDIIVKKASLNNLDVLKFKNYALDISLNKIVENPAYSLDNVNKELFNQVIDYEKYPDSFQKISVTPWSCLYKTLFLRKNNILFNDLKCVNDRSFNVNVIIKAQRFMFTEEYVVHHRINNPNSLIGQRGKYFDCHFKSYNYIFEKLKDQSDTTKITILSAELRDIFVWYNKYQKNELLKKEVYEKTYNFFKKLDLKVYGKEIEKQLWYKDYKKLMQSKDSTCADNNDKKQEVNKNHNEKAVKVTVILPVYNVEKYLKQCLDSILNQTLKNIEVICIDDGSTDNSYKVLRNYSLKDSRVYVLRQENKGAGAARNRGLDVANGEYLSFLDSDDFFAPTMLEEMYELAKANDNDIVICKTKAFNQQTKKEEQTKWTLKERLLPSKKVFSCYDISDYAFNYAMGWAWDKLYKRTFIQIHGIKFQEIRTSNDAFFTFIANLKARKISVVNKELAIHRIKTKTSLSQTRELSYDCFYKALIAIKNELIEYGIYYDFERAFISWALQFCIWHFNTISDESKQKQKLYKFLKKKCFKELEFHKYPREWFYKKEYECYLRIKKLPFANNNKLNNLYVVTSWPFRMIRNFFRCWRDNGFKYTMTRVRVKLKFVKDKLKSMTTKGKE